MLDRVSVEDNSRTHDDSYNNSTPEKGKNLEVGNLSENPVIFSLCKRAFSKFN